jgi:2-methylaconitate cis-trans-isomerase PrpF
MKTKARIRMGYPSGCAELEHVDVSESSTSIEVKKLIVSRTARRLMEGYAFVRKEVL